MTVNKPIKIGLIVLATLVVIGLLVFSTVAILRQITPRSSESSKDSVETLKTNAANEENSGNAPVALATYKKLLAQYQTAGDEARAADAQAKIKQLEQIIADEEKAKIQDAIDAKARAAAAGAPDPATEQVK